MISVITPSIRPQFLDIAQKCLELQTTQDFEWLTEVGLRNKGYDLPSAWNRLLRRAQGDIIVMYQDCITIPKDALEKIAKLNHNKKAYTYPVGKAQFESETTQEGVFWDWRKYRNATTGNDYIPADHWETDLASAPKSLFFDVGGFDEIYNQGWSWENVEIAVRAEAAGYKFICSTVTDGVAFDHDAKIENPYRNKMRNNDWRVHNTRTLAQTGSWKLEYLP